MSFARQKRLLLGWTALLAPIPLPFNGVVGWPTTLAFLLGVVLFLRRARLVPARWLPSWGMKVRGWVYRPGFCLDMVVISRGLVQPGIHLCLFAVLVKL